MANLLATLRSSADAMGVYQKALDVTQSNLGNASTPGYARQRLTLLPRVFDPWDGMAGGVAAGPVVSSRDDVAESNVRRQVEGQGKSNTQAELLAGVEEALPVDAGAGIASALTGLMRSFSNWSLAPNDVNARQSVLDNAGTLAQSFQDTAQALTDASRSAEQQLGDTVDKINTLTASLRDYNAEARRGTRGDAGLDARVHSTLEDLAELVDFTAIPQEDGSVTVLAGNSVPLVIGDRQYSLHLDFATPPGAAYPDGPAPACILDDNGADVTGRFTGGRLGGALDLRNQVIPGLIGDTSQQGQLNQLASTLADRVNTILGDGWTADGATPPENLFVYNADNATASARTLAVNPSFAPEMLAATDPGPPYVSNGTALKLASLAQSQDPADRIDGAGFLQYYSSLAAAVGRRTADAQQSADLQGQFVAQARSLRSETQGVSLDEEAVTVIEFQRAYQAAAQMITVLNELTQTAVDLLK